MRPASAAVHVAFPGQVGCGASGSGAWRWRPPHGCDAGWRGCERHRAVPRATPRGRRLTARPATAAAPTAANVLRAATGEPDGLGAPGALPRLGIRTSRGRVGGVDVHRSHFPKGSIIVPIGRRGLPLRSRRHGSPPFECGVDSTLRRRAWGTRTLRAVPRRLQDWPASRFTWVAPTLHPRPLSCEVRQSVGSFGS